ncbi:MAG TPA: cell division protein FtsW [Bacteroidetes bacterium]|nr:cell division protein FtsW [Bacteroidota bacterium]
MFNWINENIKGDKVIWIIVLLLSIFSLLAVYSSTTTLAYRLKGGNTEFYLIKHLCLVLFGLFLMYVFHHWDYRYLSKISVAMLLITIPLLLFTLILGTSLNQASRWLTLPILNISFQTSDLAKLSLLMYLSRNLSRIQKEEQSIVKTFLLKQALPILVVCGLILPADLSTAIILGITAFILLFIGRVNMRYILGAAGFVILMGFISALVIKNHKSLGLENVGRVSTWNARMDSYLNLEDNVSSNYQVKQAKIAIATGGLVFGKGPGKSNQRDFLPHPYSDFIYAIIIEEYGLLFGGVLVLFLYLLFLFRTLKILFGSPKAFGALLAVGLGFSLCMQAIIHMAVNVSLLPVTGLTLPFVSMGGTSIIFTSISVGIILSVSKNSKEEKISVNV